MSSFQDQIRISLLNTNYNALSEQKLIAFAGDFQWQCISKTIGIPLSLMKTHEGNEVYAAFFYVELTLPEKRTLKEFKLDQNVHLINYLSGFKNISAKGEIYFDNTENVSKDKSPSIIFGNTYISPGISNESLKLNPSVLGSFANFKPLPNDENPYLTTRACKEKLSFDLFKEGWQEICTEQEHIQEYEINPDRDSNGAGLVYFSNYIAFLDFAERKILSRDSFASILSAEAVDQRTIKHRKLGYFGNANLGDIINIKIRFFKNPKQSNLIGLHCLIHRKHDQKLICVSECIKDLGPHQIR